MQLQGAREGYLGHTALSGRSKSGVSLSCVWAFYEASPPRHAIHKVSQAVENLSAPLKRQLQYNRGLETVNYPETAAALSISAITVFSSDMAKYGPLPPKAVP